MAVFFLNGMEVRIEPSKEAGIHVVKTGGEEHLVLAALEEDFPSFHFGNRMVPFQAVRSRDKLQVWVDGEIYLFQISTSALKGALAETPLQSNQVSAPMPGRILKIYTKEGDSFQSGDPLLVMESMKMEMTLSASVSGKITRVRCSVGRLVEMGEILLELEPGNG